MGITISTASPPSADLGDEVRLEPAKRFIFALDGPQAGALQGADPADNLVTKAARSLADLTGHALDVKLTLTKRLPVASGIGGGSSDAAAALRLLARHWGLADNDPRLTQAAAQHGQDVPLCLAVAPAYLNATGTAPGPVLPPAGIVLVNPNKGLPTPAVYKSFREHADPFTPAAPFPHSPAALPELVSLLKARHNDLYSAACRLMPEISIIVTALENSAHCLFARMSGSGATCFGLYNDPATAQHAAHSASGGPSRLVDRSWKARILNTAIAFAGESRNATERHNSASDPDQRDQRVDMEPHGIGQRCVPFQWFFRQRQVKIFQQIGMDCHIGDGAVLHRVITLLRLHSDVDTAVRQVKYAAPGLEVWTGDGNQIGKRQPPFPRLRDLTGVQMQGVLLRERSRQTSPVASRRIRYVL